MTAPMNPTTAATPGVVPTFDINGSLPDRVTMLEASAGTGKTYALAGLALRYIAEGHVLVSQLCVVTFTEATTAELRGRLRLRLAEAVTYLSGADATSDDPVLLQLGAVDDAERRVRLERVGQALAEFDTATISTIHGFCTRVVATGSGPSIDSPIGSGSSDVMEVATDHFIAAYGPTAAGAIPVPYKNLLKAVNLRLKIPDAEMLRIDPPDAKSTARCEQIALAADLVDEVLHKVLERRTTDRVRTFDSLITDARSLLHSPAGEAIISELRKRFSVVMIDEFQDTDSVQWDIFRTAFLEGSNPVTVILVGDPKQSIYRFRSAEISAYLTAREYTIARGGIVAGLDTNWRSDKPLLDALETLFAGYQFGDPSVSFQPVKAAPKNLQPRLGIGSGVDPATTAPVQFRSIASSADGSEDAKSLITTDLVAEVTKLLNTATLTTKSGTRPLRTADIGILVRSNADATRFANALNEAGIPAASSSNDSVLESEAAAQWRRLLAALDRPASTGLVRTASIGWFVGLDLAEVAALTDDETAELFERFRGWATALTEGGLPRLLAALRGHGLAERVLSTVGGERDLTDLDHIVELLQGVTGGRPTTPGLLLAALDSLDGDGEDGESASSELFDRRIDRDDDTVKVITVHKAKGLEWPVVLCPTLWTGGSNRGLKHAWMETRRVIDTNKLLAKESKAKAFIGVANAAREEEKGEFRRQLYVALTRAQSRLIMWWAASESEKKGKTETPLGHLLAHATDGDPKDIHLDTLVAKAEGTIEHVALPARIEPVELVVESRPEPELSVAIAARELDSRWRIWSFSAIKSMAEALALETPVIGGVDEPVVDMAHELALATPVDASVATETPSKVRVSRMQPMAGGTAFGTLVHSIYERVDFAVEDLESELREVCADALRYRPVRDGNGFLSADNLAAALFEAAQAPLGGPLGDRALAGLSAADRMNELDFDISIARIDAATVANVMLEHLDETDPLRPWFVDAANGALAVDVEGLLTGSIDLVARTSIDAESRFWIADYKTNWLKTGDYGQSSLAEAMNHSAYGLQATLYLVAMHRYLRFRLPEYNPDTHLLGAAYLFVRGMVPENTISTSASGATVDGVFWWRPPTAALDALDRLFAHGSAEVTQ
ncbi:RecB ATP-dependent exoDNAse (exonuclease V) beta subunit (contains helicase and exonuclease domains) [Acidimicrobiia bacterium]